MINVPLDDLQNPDIPRKLVPYVYRELDAGQDEVVIVQIAAQAWDADDYIRRVENLARDVAAAVASLQRPVVCRRYTIQMGEELRIVWKACKVV